MLTSIQAYNERGENLWLTLEGQIGGYLVKKVDGLAPGKASLSASSSASLPGSSYLAGHRDSRNVVITLGLESDHIATTVESLRSNLYRFFMPTAALRLQFAIDGVPRYELTGIVESFETELFSQEPEVSISIICHDPDFYAFNWENYSGTSQASGTTGVKINNPGTIPVGFVLETTYPAQSTGDVLVVRVTPTARPAQSFSVDRNFPEYEEVFLSTIPGEKRLTLIDTSSGSDRSGLPWLVSGSTWPLLYPGTNEFHVRTNGPAQEYELRFQPKYGGL